MSRIDEKTVSFVSDKIETIYNHIDSRYKVVSSSTEDFGYDFGLQDVLSEQDTAHFELKTKNEEFGKWDISTTGPCLCFSFTPSTGHTIDQFPARWESKPSQTQIEAYKRGEHKKGERVRWFCLNAATGPDFNYSVEPKWLKMFNDPLSALAVLFSDGILVFNHEQLLDAVASYGYLKTWGTEEFQRSDGKYWQFKVFLDIDKGRFYPCKVPQEILPKKKRYS